ncbi:hypothetical protein BGZ59_011141, partial [Podila verticillata]
WIYTREIDVDRAITGKSHLKVDGRERKHPRYDDQLPPGLACDSCYHLVRGLESLNIHNPYYSWIDVYQIADNFGGFFGAAIVPALHSKRKDIIRSQGPMDDQIKSESSFFWELSIQPTTFTAPFCESVKRSFRFEPKSTQALYHWQCDIIEDMINGMATMTIDVHRASFETSPTPPPAVDVMLSQRNRSKVLGPPHMSEQGKTKKYLPGTSDIEYKTISIHTPKYLNPLMSAFLRGRSTDSIRGKLELDASEVLHREKYVITLALSEEKSMSQIASPSSSHGIMDSIFHDILPTAQPYPDSADVWFEFPEEVPKQQPHPSGGGFVTLGAHWCVLSKYETFLRWIEHEQEVEEEQQRQEEERIRGEQHGAEMRLLHQQQMQEIMRQEFRLLEMHRRQYPPQQAHMHVIDSICNPPPHMPMGQFVDEPYNPQYSQQVPMPFQPLPHPTCQMPPSHQPLPLYHTRPQDPTFPQTHPLPSYQLMPPSSWQQPAPHMQEALSPPYPSPFMPPPSSTSRPIPVKQFSSSTFRVLLQYLYTGQIGLTSEQKRRIGKYYWSNQPPTKSDDNEVEDKEEKEEEILDRGRVHLSSSPSPSLIASYSSSRPQFHSTTSGSSSDESGNLRSIHLPPLESMPPSGDNEPSHFAQTLAKMTQDMPTNATSTLSWLPCSRLVEDNHYAPFETETRRLSCTWESLVHISRVLGLEELHARAIKALGYHCQMMVIRTLMHSNMGEVAHNGFDETQLDLQLAMNEDLLEAFLGLYEEKGVEEGMVGSRLVVEEGEGGCLSGGASWEAEHEDVNDDDDKQGSREEVATNLGLLDGPECQDRILELCKEIRSRFLDLQGIMAQ